MKILIIWYNQIDENGSLGGVEKYNLNLINFFLKKNYEIDFLYFNNDIKNCINNKKINYIKIESNKKNKLNEKKISKNKFLALLLSLKLTIIGQLNVNSNKNKTNRFITKNKKKYFLIINNIPYFFKKNVRKLNDYVYVVHTDYKIYHRFYFYNYINYDKYSFLYKNILLFLNNAFFLNKNILKKTKNVVFFSNDEKYLKINKNAFVGSVPMELDYFLKKPDWYLNNKSNGSILYFGRFDNEQKNLKLLSDISKDGNLNIDLYGGGDYEIELKNNFLLNLKGKITNIKEKINILSEYDIFLLTSNYEGLPIATIELLSMGVIGVIRNSFLEAKNLIPKQYHDFLLINSNASVEEYIEKINYVRFLNKDLKNVIRINLINHIKNNYHTKTFENNWNKILENINKKQIN